jgi:tRNA threonylcarbamoyl adenosine modification protein YjeE
MSTQLLDQAGVSRLAGTLARELPPGAVVALVGPLGAGKTTFARAFAAARGATLDATSPTYTLVHRYPAAQGDVFHLDCYRLRDPEEARDLDWETLVTGDALLVEWPERAGAWLPAVTCTVALDHVGETTRRVAVHHGAERAS